MEIITSKVSVYEVELDLNHWDQIQSDQVPGFHSSLKTTIPTLSRHKCMSGKSGGFLLEVLNGTNFAHVIEHVILEMIHLADPEKQTYTGWTRKKEDNSYVVHYQAPDFLTGRLAAILGVDLVKRLINAEKVDTERYIELLKQPLHYFVQDDALFEPVSVIQEIEDAFDRGLLAMGRQLTDDQTSRISSSLNRLQKHLPLIIELWEKSFLEYAGEFGKAILNKIELINIDKFMDLLTERDFERFFRGIKNLSHFLNSYHIPQNFVVHSIWLYKNHLLNFIIEENEGQKDRLHQAVLTFDAFFQLILQNISDGYFIRVPEENMNFLRELREFREIKRKKGCILVIDDDDMTRRALRDILEYQGYQVVLAESGSQALNILNRHTNDITLITLDLVMPEMDGRKVYQGIQKITPDIGVLVTSGLPPDLETRSFFTGNRVDFIRKPFRIEELLEKIEALWNGK